MSSANETKDYLALDDLTVGQIFRSDKYQLDESQIIAFARNFDPQPFHLDKEAAAETIFAGLAAFRGAKYSRRERCNDSEYV
jgi:acyl dehydratase